jgi:hypothetical protein
MTPSLSDTHYTEIEFADYLGKCLRTVRRMRSRGDGPPWARINQIVYYRKSGVAEWLQSLEQGRAA